MAQGHSKDLGAQATLVTCENTGAVTIENRDVSRIQETPTSRDSWALKFGHRY